MKQTNQYKLNLIESGDTFSPTPLNENAEKMEVALAEQAQILENLTSGQFQCKFGTYTGKGTMGTNKTVISFGFNPQFVLVWGQASYVGVFKRNGVSRIFSTTGSVNPQFEINWGTNQLSLSSTVDPGYQLNDSGVVYCWVAMG